MEQVRRASHCSQRDQGTERRGHRSKRGDPREPPKGILYFVLLPVEGGFSEVASVLLVPDDELRSASRLSCTEPTFLCGGTPTTNTPGSSRISSSPWSRLSLSFSSATRRENCSTESLPSSSSPFCPPWSLPRSNPSSSCLG